MRKVIIQKILTRILIIVALLFGREIKAQTNNSTDLESWNLIQVAYKPTKKLKFDLEGQLRLKNNISLIDRYIAQIGIEYNIFKRVEIGGNLRYISKNDNDGKIQGHREYLRFNLDVVNKHKIDDFWIKYRLRYQNRTDIADNNFTRGYDKPYWRYKLGFAYNIKKWRQEPEISGELFDPAGINKNATVDGFRFTFGTTTNLKKYGKIKLFYRFQKVLDENMFETTKIIGLKYTYTFKGY